MIHAALNKHVSKSYPYKDAHMCGQRNCMVVSQKSDMLAIAIARALQPLINALKHIVSVHYRLNQSSAIYAV
jgi:hypothetical protein